MELAQGVDFAVRAGGGVVGALRDPRPLPWGTVCQRQLFQTATGPTREAVSTLVGLYGAAGHQLHVGPLVLAAIGESPNRGKPLSKRREGDSNPR